MTTRFLQPTVLIISLALAVLVLGVSAQPAQAQPWGVGWTTNVPGNQVDLSAGNPYPIQLSLDAIDADSCFDYQVFEGGTLTPASPLPAGFNPQPSNVTAYTMTNVMIDRDLDFQVECSNSGGNTIYKIPVTTFYSVPPTPPSVDIQPIPGPVTVNPTATVNVTVDIAAVDYCDLTATDAGGNPIVISGWTTATPLAVTGLTQFTRTITVSSDIDITADCNNGGADSDSDTEPVDTATPTGIGVSLTPTPAGTTGVTPGTNFTVRLSHDGADSCTLSSSNGAAETGWSSVGTVNNPPANQNYTVTIYGDVTLTADCTRGAGIYAYDRASDSLTFTTSGTGIDLAITNANLNTNYTTNAVNGTYGNLYGIIRMTNIGDVAVPGSFEIPILTTIESLMPGITNPPFAMASGPFPVETTAQNSPSPVVNPGASTGSMNTKTFGQPVPFGTHRFCFYGGFWQWSRAWVAWDVDITNNSECYDITLPVPQPPMTIEARRVGTTAKTELIRVNDSVDIYYNVNVTYALNCTVRGPGGVNVASFNAAAVGPQTVTTSPLTSTSKFVMDCTEPLTNTSFSKTLVVEVTPDFEER
ncbi:hypothetical protein KC887_01900 [Candidatus Kaiserbacteria bacterium]|nr:hypothetical protein [Candidatus Kaiserbacteria bacterium]